jgi:hypothetical protein
MLPPLILISTLGNQRTVCGSGWRLLTRGECTFQTAAKKLISAKDRDDGGHKLISGIGFEQISSASCVQGCPHYIRVALLRYEQYS